MAEGKLSVGNVEILGITDIEVHFPMPLTDLFPEVPLESWVLCGGILSRATAFTQTLRNLHDRSGQA